ncbi:glycerol-3-phosphate dehydrogenase/oxidase [Rubellimicrobium sp. CFH 75288]|uniref:glycerol-3-phosphate dehydrogenase/oxidase n=1 Tax=Rubellimicrobium sp. CFH 75288 TaxID=2697034 RepID=UPI001411DD9B|nr:glycerol-3-phosphate dehydrogenase/oxidase [Rubellimicrobium sp. CFH 75288]NAZ36361.1 FAD-dependent oxidoreductase [Rubellimicrobium sp. CFH 75288]
MTPADREARLAAILRRGVDVLIVGGGINGAGLFRDLCLQGITCLLVDKGDWCSGTSAAPSRLIHGGIKYLETGDLRLVSESTLERNRLLRNAPHLVRPLPTVLPVFSWTRGTGAALRTLLGSRTAPRSRGMLPVALGLWLYDAYGARERIMPRHRLWSRSKALGDMPALSPRIVGAGLYWDAWVTSPERLVLELVQDGLAADASSAAVSYTELAERQGGTVRLRREAGTVMAVRPRVVVNAAGPWIDHVNERLDVPGRLIGGTRGSHVILDHPELWRQLAGRMVYFEADDGRICLAFPYLGRVLAGSTDIPDDNPDQARASEQEVAYILQSLRHLFPHLDFAREQVRHVYAGVRPLPHSDAATPGLISRDHSAPVAEPEGDRPFPVVSLVGGKWTTFRGFAEEVADLVLHRLGRPRRASTREAAIGGGRDWPEDPVAWSADLAAETGLAPDRVAELLGRYGTTARCVALRYAGDRDNQRLDSDASWSLGEIERILREEDVVHLEDVVLRRTTLAITGRLGHADLERIAALAGRVLGWDEERRRREVEGTRRRLETVHGMRLDPADRAA